MSLTYNLVRWLGAEEDPHHDEHVEGDEFAAEQHDDEHGAAVPWGDVMLACFLVWLVTLSGLLLAITVRFIKRLRNNQLVQYTIIPSFAAGALLATIVFLLLPESIKLFTAAAARKALFGHDDHPHDEDHNEDHLHGNETHLDDHHNETHLDDHHNETGEDLHFLRYLQEDGHGEGDIHQDESFIWKFGVSVLGGFLFPLFLAALFPSPRAGDHQECCKNELESKQGFDADEEISVYDHDVALSSDVTGDGDKAVSDNDKPVPETTASSGADENTSVAKTMEEGCDAGECEHHNHDPHKDEGLKTISEMDDTKPVVTPSKTAITLKSAWYAEYISEEALEGVNVSLVMSIFIGDFFHNFTDGIFIGTAFLLCSRDLGYTLVATTIYHELAQELADFMLLTHHCGLRIRTAILLNALCGISVFLGAIVILAADLGDEGMAVILALSTGFYLYICSVECIPRIQKAQRNFRDFGFFFLFFVLGAIPIGLVLLNHGHCEAGHDDH